MDIHLEETSSRDDSKTLDGVTASQTSETKLKHRTQSATRVSKTLGFDQSEETTRDKTTFDEISPLVEPSIKTVKKSIKDKAEKVTLQSGVSNSFLFSSVLSFSLPLFLSFFLFGLDRAGLLNQLVSTHHTF